MANSKTILTASFALFALIGLYVLVDNGASIVQLAFVAFSLITVLALTESAGEWARIVGIVFSGFICLAATALLVFSAVKFFSSSQYGLIPMIVAPFVAMIGALAMRTLLHPVSREDSREDSRVY